MIEEIRELLQNVIAPQIEGIRGDIRALTFRIENLDSKIESCRRELLSEIGRVEGVLSADLVRLEEKVDLKLENMDAKLAAMTDKMEVKLSAMTDKLEVHRRELLAEINAALH